MRKYFTFLLQGLYSSSLLTLIGTLVYYRIPTLITLFLQRILLQGLIYKCIFVLVLRSCACLFFCTPDLYFFKKHNTSNTYNEVTVSQYLAILKQLSTRCTCPSTTHTSHHPLLQLKHRYTYIICPPENYTMSYQRFKF